MTTPKPVKATYQLLDPSAGEWRDVDVDAMEPNSIWRIRRVEEYDGQLRYMTDEKEQGNG